MAGYRTRTSPVQAISVMPDWTPKMDGVMSSTRSMKYRYSGSWVPEVVQHLVLLAVLNTKDAPQATRKTPK